jgi:cell division protein FtsL
MLLAERRSEEFNSAAGAGKTPKNPAPRGAVKKTIVKIVTISLCLIVANLVIQSLVVQRIREIKKLQLEINLLERDSDKLRVEMAELESFNHIQSVAQKDLKMRPAGPNDLQLIAAAPGYKKERTTSNINQDNSSKTIPKDGLWNQLVTWLGGAKKTMADTP